MDENTIFVLTLKTLLAIHFRNTSLASCTLLALHATKQGMLGRRSRGVYIQSSCRRQDDQTASEFLVFFSGLQEILTQMRLTVVKQEAKLSAKLKWL